MGGPKKLSMAFVSKSMTLGIEIESNKQGNLSNDSDGDVDELKNCENQEYFYHLYHIFTGL